MKPLEKIDIINSIARELQSRMTFREIYTYLKEYGIDKIEGEYLSKYFYVQDALSSVGDHEIIKIVKELKIKVDFMSKELDVNFGKLGYYRMFISHLSKEKMSAINLSKCLDAMGISAFVAHKDIEPTRKWKDEIEKALFSMDSLCAIVSPEFIESKWCDQEVGVALGREVIVIPVMKGADPYGLFGEYQGIQSNGKKANDIAVEVFKAITLNEKSRSQYIGRIKNLFLNSKSKEEAEKWIEVIQFIKDLEISCVREIHDKIIENDNLNDTKVLLGINKLSATYGLEKITSDTFIKEQPSSDNFLPF